MRSYHKTGSRKGRPAYRTPSSFRSKVYKIVKSISKGETMSYKEVARRAGNPDACRAVGSILNKNYNSKIPCHRVIKSDGSTGGYNRGERKKKELLKKEKNIKM